MDLGDESNGPQWTEAEYLKGTNSLTDYVFLQTYTPGATGRGSKNVVLRFSLGLLGPRTTQADSRKLGVLG